MQSSLAFIQFDLLGLSGSIQPKECFNRNSSKLKEFADDNFKFDENSRKFSKWLENTVGKDLFQKTCSQDAFKPGFVWEGLIRYSNEGKCLFRFFSTLKPISFPAIGGIF